MPIAMPPCCKDPEGYSSFAPTTPTSGRPACAAKSDSQEGTSGSTSSFRNTSTSPSATSAPALHMREKWNAPSYGTHFTLCLLYTSDAADEEDSVDLGGR